MSHHVERNRSVGDDFAEQPWAKLLDESQRQAKKIEELFRDPAVESSRRQLVQVAGKDADTFLRSPACLQVMKQQIDALIAARSQCSDPRAATQLSVLPPMRPNEDDLAAARDFVTPYEVMQQAGGRRLLRFRGSQSHYVEPVLICYSLVNRPYILDMLRGRSVVQRLLEQNFDVYLLDWGTPDATHATKSLGDYICDDLHEMVEFVCRSADAQRIHLLGYCMGGTMAAMYTALQPSRIGSLVLMAAPIDFEDREGLLHVWTDREYFDVDGLIGVFGNFPGELLRLCFQMMKPVQNFHEKYMTLLRKLEDEEVVANFQAMEQWTTDNVPVAGTTFREFVTFCYQKNLLTQGRLQLHQRRVDLRTIDCPLLVVTAKHDHLVPPDSSLAIAKLVSSRDIQRLSCDVGHVGLAVSRTAHQKLWPPACQWIATHSSPKNHSAQAVELPNTTHERSRSMSEQANLDTLRKSKFFQNVSDDHLGPLAEISRVVEYPAKKTIFGEFDQANDVHVIVSGDVSVVVCEPKVGCRQLTTVHAGELLGWSPLLERGRMSATAVTQTPTKAIVIDGEKLIELCQKDPAIGYEFMTRTAQVLAERLFATRVQLLELSGVHLPEVSLESD